MLTEISNAFEIHGRFMDAERFGNGLINDTYVATFQDGDSVSRYILQRINHQVFRDPQALMNNVERVCNHIAARAAAEQNPPLTLTLICTKEGKTLHHHQDANGLSYWRCFEFIENCISYDTVESVDQAYHAALKFGEFQNLVADISGERLVETIPDFHNTPMRFTHFLDAVKCDTEQRVADCGEIIDFAISREPIAHHLLKLHHDGLIPERVTHNDTKLSNVLLDRNSGEGVCVVDLDTVMPGLSLYDFGDLVRSCISPEQEDSENIDGIRVRMDMFEAIARGFLDGMGGIMTPCEIANLAFSGKLLAYELGLRFLTDHLMGDSYFGAKHPGHNLTRAKNQFQLVRCIEQMEPEMNACVDQITGVQSPSSHRLAI